MDWNEALRRIRAGEDVQAVLDEKDRIENADFVAYLRREGRPDLAEHYLARIKDIESGVYGARNCWHALSKAQRTALAVAQEQGGRLQRCGKEYRVRDRIWHHQPIRVATMRNLCARDLMTWEGGAFDPEAVVVLTERGRFVLKHGAGDGP